MSSSVLNTYTPPPPGKPTEASGSALKSIDYPVSATPLPPSPSISHSTTSTTQPNNNTNTPQIRYCYFISASSVAPTSSRSTPTTAVAATTTATATGSNSHKPVYLTPHVQDPMDVSPNCTQPRSSRPTASVTTTTKTTPFVLGPTPPQIQLSFLEDELLPRITSLDSLAPSNESPDSEPSIHISTASTTKTSPVERKDSGYGSSVSRSSSLAAFSRGIRKVFWRNSRTGVNSGPIDFVVTDRPVLGLDIDCEIPQDVLDHEDWAQDLAQRLTLASDTPDAAVTAWLGQLSSESDLALDQSEETFTFILNKPKNSESSHSIVPDVEELVFIVPSSQPLAASSSAPALPLSKSKSSLDLNREFAFSTTGTNQASTQATAEKSLRKVLSYEQLNKPQPPIPFEALDSKPIPPVPSSAEGTTSPFNSIAKRLATELSFGKASTKSRRPNVQDIFTDSNNDSSRPMTPTSGRQSREGVLSSNGTEQVTDESGLMTASPEQVDSKPVSKRSNRFLKSFAALTASEMKSNKQSEVRPMSEVLLSDSNLGAEEIETTSRHSSLLSPISIQSALRHPWDEPSPLSSGSEIRNRKERSGSYPLVPPKPLFYNKGDISSVSSLGEISSCGSIDSSADEWDGSSRMAVHANEQNARYNADLKDLQAMLYKVDSRNSNKFTPTHSANTSTGSLSHSVPASPCASPAVSRRENKALKGLSKKDDYMSHRMSGLSPKILPVAGKSKPISKSRLSMTYGGGELEVVKHAKFDTPEAIARNKEIRKFISQEIYTTELNYLQYLHTIKEVFVEPLFNSLETDKPFIPRSSPLYQLLAHVYSLITVSTQIATQLGECVQDEKWSDETSLVGTIFLEAKEPLSIFLKYGQSYGKGMKALRTLMKSKRGSINVVPISSPIPAFPTSPRVGKRQSLPSIFTMNPATGTPLSPLMESGHVGSRSESKPQSNHGSLTGSVASAGAGTAGEATEYERFLFNCAGGKETTSRFSLADLLILPIQRVTRYCLLLKDLKKHTNVEHEDYVCIVHALEQVHTLALATNNVQPSSMRL
ncbi:hypothetical protein BGZ80_004591 [Entomortierella chlamydospora]|uniref:DH domain-containing protein n=1 Tax=Entomortierella chlamydospora TaxID=101097 RepID=A0A9P6MLX6_9FUNG|nr:hypothetical protein BGZ79_008103 [Entomortierella chlamydospora]KAG0007506.1 hypothetical protein BGZ80_004591 [Entomortierella chlamydospora]